MDEYLFFFSSYQYFGRYLFNYFSETPSCNSNLFFQMSSSKSLESSCLFYFFTTLIPEVYCMMYLMFEMCSMRSNCLLWFYHVNFYQTDLVRHSRRRCQFFFHFLFLNLHVKRNPSPDMHSTEISFEAAKWHEFHVMSKHWMSVMWKITYVSIFGTSSSCSSFGTSISSERRK